MSGEYIHVVYGAIFKQSSLMSKHTVRGCKHKYLLEIKKCPKCNAKTWIQKQTYLAMQLPAPLEDFYPERGGDKLVLIGVELNLNKFGSAKYYQRDFNQVRIPTDKDLKLILKWAQENKLNLDPKNVQMYTFGVNYDSGVMDSW